MRPYPEQKVIQWIDKIPLKELGLTAITMAEILYGIGILPEGKRKRQLFEIAQNMFEQDFAHRIFPFNQMTAIEYSHIVIQREKRGNPISMPDAQIAAICSLGNYTLATRNLKDFEHTGINILNPWEA